MHFFQVQRDNVTHYVSGDLRFSFKSNDGIPLKQKLRVNQIPLYILRGLSRRWGLRVLERYGQKEKEKVHNVQSIVFNDTKMFDKHISTVSRDSYFSPNPLLKQFLS